MLFANIIPLLLPKYNNNISKEGYMDFDKKKTLLNIVYYSTIAVMVAFVVFLFLSLAGANLATWERIMFYILVGALAGVVVYDVVCTCIHNEKYISGLILYVITMLVVIFTLIVFALNSGSIRLFIDISERFFRLILLTYIINALAVVIYCVGQSLIKIDSNRK